MYPEGSTRGQASTDLPERARHYMHPFSGTAAYTHQVSRTGWTDGNPKRESFGSWLC